MELTFPLLDPPVLIEMSHLADRIGATLIITAKSCSILVDTEVWMSRFQPARKPCKKMELTRAEVLQLVRAA